MKVILQTTLNIEGNRGFRTGEFSVPNTEFRKDPNFAVAIVAYEWIQQQMNETGHRETVIEKVIWNEKNDITQIVREIHPVIPEDTLPF